MHRACDIRAEIKGPNDADLVFWAPPRIPGLMPPEVLIFFRMPKTGGNTMDGVFEHCLPGRFFHAHTGNTQSALLVRSTEGIRQKFAALPRREQQAVRCLIGTHVSLDIDTIFDRPTKFFTIVREPVDRVISNFFHIRAASHLTSYPFIKDMTLDQYLDSGIGLDADNHQVRLLSGCPELDAPWDPEGRPISTPPVEPRHLELAKQHIEDRFLTAAPLEAFTALVWFLKRLYGWPVRRVFFDIRNETPDRPHTGAVPERTRWRLHELNKYDVALYEWVKLRFAKQIRPLEPRFSRQVRRFERMNRYARHLGRLSPEGVRNAGRRLLFPQPIVTGE
jgi:Sulfotransferase family